MAYKTGESGKATVFEALNFLILCVCVPGGRGQTARLNSPECVAEDNTDWVGQQLLKATE